MRGKRPPIFSDNDIRNIVQMYEAGFSLSEVASHFYCSKDAVKQRLLAEGVKLRPKGGSKPFRNATHQELESIRFMYEYQGMSTSQIADALGMHRTTISKRLRRMGVTPRDKSQALRLLYATRY